MSTGPVSPERSQLLRTVPPAEEYQWPGTWRVRTTEAVDFGDIVVVGPGDGDGLKCQLAASDTDTLRKGVLMVCLHDVDVVGEHVNVSPMVIVNNVDTSALVGDRTVVYLQNTAGGRGKYTWSGAPTKVTPVGFVSHIGATDGQVCLCPGLLRHPEITELAGITINSGVVSLKDTSIFFGAADNTKLVQLRTDQQATSTLRAVYAADRDVYLEATPDVIKKTITPSDLTAAALQQDINFSSLLPAYAQVTGVWFKLDANFGGGGATTATVSIGDTTLPVGWWNAESVIAPAGLGVKTSPATSGVFLARACDIDSAARTPVIRFASDVNVNTLTTGNLTAYIHFNRRPSATHIP